MTVMAGVEIDAVVIEEFEQALPCDYIGAPEEHGPQYNGCHGDGIARWVLYLDPCCPGVPGSRLACDACKAVRMMSEGAVECADCGTVTSPARHAYVRVETIGKAA